MKYRKFRITLSKGWTLIVCSFSVMILALTGSCKSKKVSKSAESAESFDASAEEVVDEFSSPNSDNTLSPILIMDSDSKEVREMINQVNALKKEMSDRMNSVIYGTPEVMQRRAEENRAMRHQIDSIDNEIRKARQK